ncbi:hypothetical protein ACROYT_G025364 [Oculina patagonica]
MGPQVNLLKVSTDGAEGVPSIFEQFPGCCEGIGKLKDFQLKVPIDSEVQPIAQPIRRVPYHLRDKLSDKLDELVKLDIIEKVSGPSLWVSPVVVVPKPSGDIRLCVDMRQANMAVKRERYPIPTIDEVLQDLNQSKFFSKLDLNSAYHQIELSPESRDITTFCTHKGLYRYKRLMFGISCAPEMYQKVLQQVLQDCDGAHNILDDVIVHAATEEEHDRRFENVVRVLSSKGLTLNRDKCQFKMSHLEFMGHVLSARGIGPADVKVKAVVDAREPTSAAEVRSFLGLVNFTARFIPDLATVSAPLRQLTKNGEPFVWGLEQQKSFEELKKRLSSAETLGYFDKNAPTKRASEHDPELKSVRECLLNGKWHAISAIGKLVLRGTRIVVPKQLRSQVLKLAHEGHPRIVSMKQRLRTKVWWPGIDKEAEKACKTCHGCQLVSQPSKPEPMSRTELPSAPWQHLAADLLGPLPSGDYVFVVVDYYSRFFEMEFTKSTTSEKIVPMLSKIFVTHGLPLSLRTDNGPQFVSDYFEKYLEENGIEHRKTTPLWPQANGEIERQNRSILKRLRIAQAEGRNWKSEMDNFLVMYRSTPHSTTGVSPAELLFGRRMRTKLPQLQEFSIEDEVRDHDSERKEKGKVYADSRRNACESEIQEGDKVLLRQEKENKLSTPFKQSPFTVVQKNGNSVLVEADGVQYRRNVTHVKKYLERDNDVLPATSKSSDVSEAQRATQTSPSQEFSEPVPSGTTSEGKPVEYKHVMEQSDATTLRPSRVKRVPSKFQDYVLGCVQLVPG